MSETSHHPDPKSDGSLSKSDSDGDGLESRVDESTPSLIARLCTMEGPLPPPAMLEEYEKVLPGAAERICALAEEEARHRRQMDQRSLDAAKDDRSAERAERRLGQILGFITCMGLIIAGVLIAAITRSTTGTIVGGLVGAGGLASVIVAFVSGRGEMHPDESFEEE
ncbi:MAG: DUF2335 domain-containing protein [Phycisphaerae bacterium]